MANYRSIATRTHWPGLFTAGTALCNATKPIVIADIEVMLAEESSN